MRIPGPALLLPLFLAGCAIPPAVTVASLVLDGVSFVTTGKGTADHAISAIAQEDCALLRAVGSKPVCDPDGEVLIALVGTDPANEDWNLDPEIGSPGSAVIAASELQAAAEPVAGQQLASAAATDGQQYQNRVAVSTPALTPGPVGQGGTSVSPLSDAIAAVAKPSPRGILAKAQPSASPQDRQLPKQKILKFNIPQQSAGQVTRVIQGSGQINTYAVIGSFRSAENARRMGESHGNDGLIQTIEVNGTTTHRVLLERPVEQARSNGFPDAWPVRLCSADLGQPPCGHLVVSQGGVFVEVAANQPRR